MASVRMSFVRLIAIGMCIALLFTPSLCGDSSAEAGEPHAFAIGQVIPLYGNKVGPFANPSEQYEYYTLPICPPKEEERKAHGLGEVLSGDRMVKTKFKLAFRKDVDKAELCKMEFGSDEVEALQTAIENDFFFEMHYDDLPLWGFIGEAREEPSSKDADSEALEVQDEGDDPEKDDEEEKPEKEKKIKHILFTHYIFNVAYNGDRIIEINWENDMSEAVDLDELASSDEEGEDDDKKVPVQFKYSVRWSSTDTPFEKRMEKYVEKKDDIHLEIHWISIMGNVVTVLLLMGFLATIFMRVLRNDFSRYADPDLEVEEEETGWKLVHGDVFRTPKHLTLLCSVVGNGIQLMILLFGMLFLALLGAFYHTNRGALLVAALLLFAFTTCINGYICNSWFKKLGGTNWVRATVMSYTLYIGPFFAVATVLNFVAVAYNSSTALPFGTVVIILLILLLVSVPLHILGSIAGRQYGSPLQAPARTNKIPREIPALPFWRNGWLQATLTGFLPFSAIYIELSELFNAIWGYQVFTLWGILLICYCILLIVTAFITVAQTYFQLAAEDYRWWWRSIFGGGSTAIFIFVKCFFFWQASKMSGFMQGAFFFGYMSLICYGSMLMLGAIGFLASMKFVRIIYSNVKLD